MIFFESHFTIHRTVSTPTSVGFKINTPFSIYLFCLLLTCLLFFPLDAAAEIQSPSSQKVFKLFILDSQNGNPYDEVRAALLMQLEEYGYVQGKNLDVTLRVAGNDVKKGEQQILSQIKNGYDAVFVGGTIATIAAKNTLFDRTIPVVFGSPTDPVGIGVINNFQDLPVANFTGVCYPVPVSARLRFIRKLLPNAKKLGMIYADMPQSHSYNAWLRDVIATVPEFKGIEVIFRAVSLVKGEHGDQEMSVRAIKYIKELDPLVDAFIKPNDQMGTRRHFAEVVNATATKPLFGITKADVMKEWGATAVVYPSHESIGRQAASMIHHIFKGGKPADIVPQWPSKFGFAVDLRKTSRFQIKVPIEILRLSGENIIK